MWMQTINKNDTERVWINVTNSEAMTITAHWPTFLFLSCANASSTGTNEAGIGCGTGVAVEAATGIGSFIGLAYEDIPPNKVEIVQCYGYHESALIMRIVGSVTVIPGNAMGPGSGAASVGLSSTGALQGLLGPVVALDTVTATLHSLGTVGANYADHVFLRCM